MRTAPILCWLTAAALFPSPGLAQTVADVERALLPLQSGALSSLRPSFWESLAALRSEEATQRALRADILFGLSGDEAGDRSLYKLTTGISLTRGEFPSELGVVSRLGLQLRDGVLQEDVTTLQLTYDYHASDALQYFAFTERFSDSFLSIQHRYEIGFGLRVATRIGSAGEEAAFAARVDTVRAGLAGVAAPAGATPVGSLSVSVADVDRLSTAADKLRRGVRERDAKLIVGLAASVFAEMERADLAVISVPIGVVSLGDSVRSQIDLPSEQRYRLSLRPTLRWRPSRAVQLRIFPYFKLPLGGQRKVTLANGEQRLDYRSDLFSEVSWALAQAETGLENVEFVLTYNHYVDNVPPSLPATMIATEQARAREYTTIQAERSHRFVALALRVRW